MRIFQIGFNKCGTRTIHAYLRKQGLASVHYDKGKLAMTIFRNLRDGRPLVEGYEEYSVFTDMDEARKDGFHFEAYKLFPYLYVAYPDAIFILNTRDREDWIKSRLAHPGYPEFAMRIYGLESRDEVVEVWRKDWDQHHQRVMEFFRDKGRFFVFDLRTDGPQTFADHIPEITFNPDLYRHVGKTDKGEVEGSEDAITAAAEGESEDAKTARRARRKARRAARAA